jgi:phage terminase large subunit-like protein
MASNVSIETDAAGNWKPSKRKSTERIDGIVGLIMGLARAATQPVEEENYWTPEMGVTL